MSSGSTERREPLSGWAVTVLVVAILFTMACMGLGFWSSWGNLSAGAAAHGWLHPWHLPATLDSSVVAFVLLDQLAVGVFGVRSRWLRWTAWAIAGFSVWANYRLGSGDLTWHVISAAMPAVWVLGVEAVRYFWTLLRRSAHPQPDLIPAGRWLADPAGTLRMRRRMLLCNITSYAEALAVQRACLLAKDLVEANPGWDKAPALLQRQIGTWDLPAAVTAVIAEALADGSAPDLEPSVRAWAAADLTRSDRHSASLETARSEVSRAASPEPAEQPAGEAVPQPSEEAAGNPSGQPAGQPAGEPANEADEKPLRMPSKTQTRKMSGADLVPYIRQFLGADPLPTKDAIIGKFHVGAAKATEAWELMRRERIHGVPTGTARG